MEAAFPVPEASDLLGLQQQIARYQALLEASRQLHSTVDESEVLDRVLRIVVRELEMDGATFAGTDLAYPEPLSPELSLDSLPSFPLSNREGQPMAALVVAAPGGRELTIYETDFLEGLVLQAALALENARNYQRSLTYVRMQQDLDAARLIQRSLLPQKRPEIPGYTLAFRYSPCYAVGGDYLDFVFQPNGRIVMVVADVAGKGMASAIVSTGFRSAFRAMAARSVPLDELAERLNQQQWEEGEEARRRFVTAIFLRLDPEIGSIEVVNAGHNPGILLATGHSPRLFEASGTPLGLLPGRSYQAEYCLLPRNARLLFYTDGLTEVFRGEEEYGPERLLEEFSNCSDCCANGILDALWTAVESFSAGTPQSDDMTALALCRAPETQRPDSDAANPDSTSTEMRA